MVDRTKKITVNAFGESFELPISSVARAAEVTRGFSKDEGILSKSARSELFRNELIREQGETPEAKLRKKLKWFRVDAYIALDAVKTLQNGTREYDIKTQKLIAQAQKDFIEFFATQFLDLI